MKNIIIILFVAIFTSCAQMVQKAKVSLNKDKYEKQLPYKEGDIVFFQASGSDYRKAKIQIQSGSQIRYGLKGAAYININGIRQPYDFDKIGRNYESKLHHPLDTGHNKSIQLKAKILKVDRDCEPYSNPSQLVADQCSVNSSYIDEAEFVDWGGEFHKQSQNYIKMMKNHKNKLAVDENLDKEAERYERSDSYLNDTACYFNYVISDAQTAFEGKSDFKYGLDSLSLMSKNDLKKEIEKGKSQLSYHAQQYKKKTGKNWSATSCSSFQEIKKRGEKYGVLLFQAI